MASRMTRVVSSSRCEMQLLAEGQNWTDFQALRQFSDPRLDGCVSSQRGWEGGVTYSITRTGDLVLRLVRSYESR